MKLSKMIGLCRKSKHVYIYEDGDAKYLSDGHVFFRLKDYSSICLNNIFEFMDVSDDKKDDYITAVRPARFETYIDDSTPCEKLEMLPKGICMPDPVIPFRSDSGLLLIDESLFNVFMPFNGFLQYYLSDLRSPMVLLVCNKYVIGGILPIECDFEKLYGELSAMTHSARDSYLNHFNSTSHQVTISDVMEETQWE